IKATIRNTDFISNKAGYTGALGFIDTDVRIDNCNFDNNQSTIDYPATISSYFGGSFKCSNSSFTNNKLVGDPNATIIDADAYFDSPDFRFNYWGADDGPSGSGSGSGQPVGSGYYIYPYIGVSSPPKHKGGKINAKDCAVSYAKKGDKTTGNPISLDEGEKRLDENDIQLNTPLGALAFT